MTETRQVVFITGASSGIGRAAAIAFARAGHHVCGLARRGDRLESLRDEIDALPSPHGDFLAAVGDVRDPAQIEAAALRTLERFGRLDVLLANAGVGHHGAVVDGEWDDIETVLRSNIDGVLHCVRAAAPAMRKQGGGHILLVSSIVAGIHTPYTAAYAASKAFVSSLAGSLRLELEDDNIAVTDVLAGRTQTEFNQNRLGLSQEVRGGLPTITADDVALALVKAAERRPRRLILRLFDRFILAGGVIAPGMMARMAKRQYKPTEDE
ncbi:MAG: SDR family NAD(P)-dependent oxidoreductase [Chloroflexota bacterium]|nr:SDR family NAD(P)-dependent oxidoreductase [Chloroflexota bacterium]MDE2946643.1 SDR family NAD(P)-dependent oxidoreductase [Chloroflexota bacterium]